MTVAVTGGIGSGKSTLCSLFAGTGITVYDSDSQAKRLMNSSPELVHAIKAAFGECAYDNGELNRAYLASEIFSDDSKRGLLESLVHPAVMDDFRQCAAADSGPYVVFESAILFESGLAPLFDRVVAVVAPLELRIRRTCLRDGFDVEAVRRRIAAQMSDDELCERADYTVVNIDREALAADFERLDAIFREEARNAAR